MIQKFKIAFRQLGTNLGLFFVLILLLQVPLWLVSEVIPKRVDYLDGVVAFISALFIMPFVDGSFLHVYFESEAGRRARLADSLRSGIRWWKRLFIVNLLPLLYMVAGMVMCILPGVILAIRYSFINFAAVLEAGTAKEIRGRSFKLTNNREWQIICAWLFTGIPNVPFYLFLFPQIFEIDPATRILICLPITIVSGLLTVVAKMVLLQIFRDELEYEQAQAAS